MNPTRLHLGAVLALAATAYYVNSIVGPSQFFLSRQDLDVAITDAGFRTNGLQVGSAILQNIGQVPILFVLAAYTARMIRRPDTRTIEMKLWWLALLAANVVVNNPISNARYWFLTVVVGTIYALPRLSANLYRFTIIGGLLGALIVFPYADVFRYQAAHRSDVVIKPIAETLASKDYDQWTMTANGVWFATLSATPSAPRSRPSPVLRPSVHLAEQTDGHRRPGGKTRRERWHRQSVLAPLDGALDRLRHLSA